MKYDNTEGHPDMADPPFGEDFPDEEFTVKQGPLFRIPRPWDAGPVLVFFFLCFFASLLFQNRQWGPHLYVSGETVLQQHQWWRVVTSLFVHSDFSHLFSNAILFVLFGWMLRAYFGLVLFPVASIIIGAATNWITVAAYPPEVRLIGASGMGYGMVALWLVFYMKYDVERKASHRFMRALGFSLAMLVPPVVKPGISYLSHGIGFAVGLGVAFLLIPFVPVIEKKE